MSNSLRWVCANHYLGSLRKYCSLCLSVWASLLLFVKICCVLGKLSREFEPSKCLRPKFPTSSTRGSWRTRWMLLMLNTISSELRINVGSLRPASLLRILLFLDCFWGCYHNVGYLWNYFAIFSGCDVGLKFIVVMISQVSCSLGFSNVWRVRKDATLSLAIAQLPLVCLETASAIISLILTMIHDCGGAWCAMSVA